MEIVIKISNYDKEWITNGYYIPEEINTRIAESIANGTPLPEQQPCEDWYDVPSDEMTLEQARQAVKDLRKKLAECLWQEPCEDCVSRKELLGRIDAERRHLLDIGMDGAEHIIVHHARRIIEDMPSVKPQRPKGKWIFHKPFDDGCKNCNECVECSQCHIWLGYDCYAKTLYCPNCGAEMEGEG